MRRTGRREGMKGRTGLEIRVRIGDSSSRERVRAREEWF
jgi:hypothetical protein